MDFLNIFQLELLLRSQYRNITFIFKIFIYLVVECGWSALHAYVEIWGQAWTLGSLPPPYCCCCCCTSPWRIADGSPVSAFHPCVGLLVLQMWALHLAFYALSWFEWESPSIASHVWTCVAPLTVLSRDTVEPLGSGALLEEVHP